jgi:hypothetical protein
MFIIHRTLVKEGRLLYGDTYLVLRCWKELRDMRRVFRPKLNFLKIGFDPPNRQAQSLCWPSQHLSLFPEERNTRCKINIREKLKELRIYTGSHWTAWMWLLHTKSRLGASGVKLQLLWIRFPHNHYGVWAQTTAVLILIVRLTVAEVRRPWWPLTLSSRETHICCDIPCLLIPCEYSEYRSRMWLFWEVFLTLCKRTCFTSSEIIKDNNIYNTFYFCVTLWIRMKFFYWQNTHNKNLNKYPYTCMVIYLVPSIFYLP